MSWLTFIPVATPSMQRQETVDMGVEAAKTSAKWVDDKASSLAESRVGRVYGRYMDGVFCRISIQGTEHTPLASPEAA